MKKILLFDFDGTIADSFESFLTIVDRLCEKYNFPKIPPEDIELLRSEEPKAILKHLKIPIYKIPMLARDVKKMQAEFIAKIMPIKGLPEILRKLKEDGYEMSILTSNGEENVRHFLEKNNIEAFDHIHTDASFFGKSNAITSFIKELSYKKEDILYIGDEIRDIQASHKAGVKIISVTWGFNSKEGLKKYNPDFIAEKPKDLLDILVS